MFKKNYKILLQFAKYPWKEYTLQQIKKIIKSKSESYVYDNLKNFEKEGILTTKKAGNVVLYLANNSKKAISYFSMCLEHEAWQNNKLPHKNLQSLFELIPTKFYICLVTGSYVKNKQKKTSDLDVVIITDNTTDIKTIYAELRIFCEMSIPPIHLYVFKEEEFLKMLLHDKPNYGKEIVNSCILLSGANSYMDILMEARKNGFNG